jgi:carbonic anhydrase
VTAEDLMGVMPGEVFVHRNVANMVVSTDNNLNAALHPSDMGQLNSWLQTLRDVYRLHRDELDAITDEKKRFDRLVELNVQEKCVNIIKIDHLQRSWYKTGFPTIHGWVFDVRSGELKDLGLDMEEVFAEIRIIYDLKPQVDD